MLKNVTVIKFKADKNIDAICDLLVNWIIAKQFLALEKKCVQIYSSTKKGPPDINLHISYSFTLIAVKFSTRNCKCNLVISMKFLQVG